MAKAQTAAFEPGIAEFVEGLKAIVTPDQLTQAKAVLDRFRAALLADMGARIQQYVDALDAKEGAQIAHPSSSEPAAPSSWETRNEFEGEIGELSDDVNILALVLQEKILDAFRAWEHYGIKPEVGWHIFRMSSDEVDMVGRAIDHVEASIRVLQKHFYGSEGGGL